MFEMEFKFDERGFKRALDRVAKDAVRQTVREMQEMLDSVQRPHGGKPAAEVRQHLVTAARRYGLNLTEPDLTTYATAISQGTHIAVQAG